MPTETVNQNADIGKELTFKEMLDQYSIEIPKVQRDYVQGRNTDHAKMVRENLLKDINDAIDSGPLNLGFVYGKVSDNNKLIPLDGQQRLTLLFLFHIFAFANDVSATDWLGKFSYETRHSSKRFIKELVKDRANVFANIPSEIIKDAAWFQDEWLLDPTVQSIFVLLDAIYDKFRGQDIRTALTEGRKVVVMFLPMSNLGLEDSLYIKLNARGRPLTDWENYKAKLVGRVEETLPNTAKEFEYKLDVTWTDLFWKMSKDTFDNAFRRFFEIEMSNYGKRDIAELGADELNAFMYCLDYLSGNQEKKAFETFKTCCIGDVTYKDKVLLHAITVYMSASEGKDKDGSFEQWMRIFRNLALNTVFNNDDGYRRACVDVSSQRKHFDVLLDNLASGAAKINGFRVEQISEEVLKAKLICRDTGANVRVEIYKAEKHPYFDGNIDGVLYFAGYSLATVDIDVNDMGKLDALKKYSGKIDKLFSEKGLTCDKILFRRALLSYGNYLITQGDNRSFCAEPKGSRFGWKVFLRKDQRDYFKAVLDKLDDLNDIDKPLKEIVTSADVKEDDWRYHFVKTASSTSTESFLGYVGRTNWGNWASDWLIRWDADWRKIALLEKTKLSGRWRCAGILALSFVLDAKGIKNECPSGTGYLWRDNNWYLYDIEPKLGVKKISINSNGDFIIERENEDKAPVEPITAKTIDDVLKKIGV